MYRANRNTPARLVPPMSHTRGFVTQSTSGTRIEEAVHKARQTNHLNSPILRNVGA